MEELAILAGTEAIKDLIPLLVSFLKNLMNTDMANNDCIILVVSIVEGIERDHPDWDTETKRKYAFDAVKQWAVETNKIMPDSLVNTLIELAVQQIKAVQQAALQ